MRDSKHRKLSLRLCCSNRIWYRSLSENYTSCNMQNPGRSVRFLCLLVPLFVLYSTEFTFISLFSICSITSFLNIKSCEVSSNASYNFYTFSLHECVPLYNFNRCLCGDVIQILTQPCPFSQAPNLFGCLSTEHTHFSRPLKLVENFFPHQTNS